MIEHNWFFWFCIFMGQALFAAYLAYKTDAEKDNFDKFYFKYTRTMAQVDFTLAFVAAIVFIIKF